MKPTLLSIAIPTYNRANFLDQNLGVIAKQLNALLDEKVEIIVSDNCSSDSTFETVDRHINLGLKVKYIKNKENLGWARNFTQCFKMARGKYVLLLGDDDQIAPGGLQKLLECIASSNYGVVAMQPYGYDYDPISEHPKAKKPPLAYEDNNFFILAVSQFFTLTSALVLNKSLIQNVNPDDYISYDLATFHLFLRASLSSKKNLYIREFMVASKRQNSFSYDFADVFIRQFWEIIENHRQFGIKDQTIQSLLRYRLLSYYPFYMFDIRRNHRSEPSHVARLLKNQYGENLLLKVWLLPILILPYYPALIWGICTTIVGRTLGGGGFRGIVFLKNKIKEFIRVKLKTIA